jgi:hypothetical protein
VSFYDILGQHFHYPTNTGNLCLISFLIWKDKIITYKSDDLWNRCIISINRGKRVFLAGGRTPKTP